MKVICSWCNGLIAAGDPALPISHGCCPRCVAKMLEPSVSDVERTIENAQRGHQAAA